MKCDNCQSLSCNNFNLPELRSRSNSRLQTYLQHLPDKSVTTERALNGQVQGRKHTFSICQTSVTSARAKGQVQGYKHIFSICKTKVSHLQELRSSSRTQTNLQHLPDKSVTSERATDKFKVTNIPPAFARQKFHICKSYRQVQSHKHTSSICQTKGSHLQEIRSSAS